MPVFDEISFSLWKASYSTVLGEETRISISPKSCFPGPSMGEAHES